MNENLRLAPPPASPIAWLLLGAAWLVAVAIKVGFSLWILGHCESALPWHYLCADIGPWGEFLTRAQGGAIPYVDFSREYPVGAGTLFWSLGSFFGLKGFDGALRLQVLLSLAADLGCAFLLYRLGSTYGRMKAGVTTLLWLALPSVTVLSPLRFESAVALLLLGGYFLHRRGRPLWAVAIWSLGITVKWYPVIAIVVQQLAQSPAAIRRRAPVAIAVFVGVVLAVNAPFLLGDWIEHGHVAHWLDTYRFHSGRRLAPDTILGVTALWLGPIPFERYASLFSMAVAGWVLAIRRQMDWAPKVALVCIALLVLNRIYSPQFNLWFYPPLLLTLASAKRVDFIVISLLLIVLDLLTLAIFPFLYSGVVAELGGFYWGIAPWSGGPATELFTTLVFLRGLMLVAIAICLYRIGTTGADRDDASPG